MTELAIVQQTGSLDRLPRGHLDNLPVPIELVVRDLDSWQVWDNLASPGSMSESFLDCITGNGRVDPACNAQWLLARFDDGHAHQITLHLPNPVAITGAFAHLRLGDWRTIRYADSVVWASCRQAPSEPSNVFCRRGAASIGHSSHTA